MEIKNNTKLDTNSLAKVSLNAKNYKIFFILFIIGGLFTFVAGIILLISNSKDKLDAIIYLVLGAFIVLFSVIYLVLLPSKTYKNYIKQLGYNGIEYEYIFTDDEILISSNSDRGTSSGKLSYDIIFNVKEFDDFILIFINKINFYVISKNGFIELNDINELVTILQYKKYKRIYKQIIK